MFEVVDSFDGFEVVDEANDGIAESFLTELLLLQQPVEFLRQIQNHRPRGLMNLLVDGARQGCEVVRKLGGDGHDLFLNHLQQLNTLVFATVDCLGDPLIKGGVEFVFLDCFL